MKLMVGSADVRQDGWVSTDIDTLDIRVRSQWEKWCAENGRPEAILADNVLEHLWAAEAIRSLALMHEFLLPGGRLRVAVPDDRNPNKEYQRLNRIPVHLSRWDVLRMVNAMRGVGFGHVVPREYFGMDGTFHTQDIDWGLGYISRSSANDERNKEERIVTMLIVDAEKGKR